MKVKTAELIGPALDWAVGVAEKLHIDLVRHTSDGQVRPVEVNPTTGKVLKLYRPSDNGNHSGPIIERECIELHAPPRLNAKLWAWSASKKDRSNATVATGSGPTPLTATMRCYVAFKLGDEVEIPDELCRPSDDTA